MDSWSSIWFWILVASTGAVIAGIFCEAPEVWQAVGAWEKTRARIRKFWYIRVRKADFNGWERLCPELIEANGRHRKWVALAGLVGWTLVAIGVAGEGVSEYFVNDAETAIRAFDQALLTETQQSANSASEASSLANAFADKAEKSSTKALAEADSFKGDIKIARKEAADAKFDITGAVRQANEVTEKVQQAKNDVAVLQSLVSARHIVDIQPFIDLKPVIKGRDVFVISASGDEEAREFCSQIGDALHGAAEINFLGGCGSVIGGGGGVGIVVTGPEAKRLAEALRKATGLGDSLVKADEKPPADLRVRIYVGARQIFWFPTKK